MRTMRDFDPDWPARLHDRLNDKTIDWITAWAPEWRAHAVIGADGWAYFDGLIFDGWEPVAI
jgi:hypothetical protein